MLDEIGGHMAPNDKPELKFRIPLDTFMKCWIGAFENKQEPMTLQEMTAELTLACNALEANAEYVKAHGKKEIKTSAVTAKMNYYIKNWDVKLMKPKSKTKSKAADAKKQWIHLFEQANLIED
jgi:hypothetical protein